MNDEMASGQLDQGAWDALNEMVGRDPVFLAEMIDTFLDDAPGLMAEIEGAVASGDAAALRRAAHTLKSNSRTFGALRLGDLGQVIEEYAATARVAETAEFVRAAAAELKLVTANLRIRKGTL